jgi:hypothetical protein
VAESEDEGYRFLRNVGIHLQVYTTLQPKDQHRPTEVVRGRVYISWQEILCTSKTAELTFRMHFVIYSSQVHEFSLVLCFQTSAIRVLITKYDI